ncbi:DUF3238 domain-containing protein [Promicromonospora sp. NPDC057488]|uniref:DUF3238 domain-containing protein n=1 Tax=Promicromonospora sp. NPDC057488 TaxID=3346147 RepID=UPI00366ADB78
MRRRPLIAAAVAAVVVVSSAVAASASDRTTSGFGAGRQEAVFVVSGQRLVPASAEATRPSVRSTTEPLVEKRVVTFGVGDDGAVLDKRIDLVRSKPAPNDEGRTEFATYSATDSGEVELRWWDPSDGRILWTVTRDDAVVGRVHGDTFSDLRPAPASDATYRIEGERTVEVDGRQAQEPYLTVLEVPGIDASALGMPIDDAAILSSAKNTDVIASRAAANWQMVQQINTFIPTERAELPFDLQPCIEAYGGEGGVGYYAGDDRGFASPSVARPSVRTAIESIKEFDPLGNRVGDSLSTRTSGTRLYESNGDLLAFANADLSEIINLGGSGDNTGGIGTWSHHVADPLCSISPAIDYTLSFGGFSDGFVHLSGDHDQAPSYEWRVKTFSSFMNLYEFENRGLEYLLPTFPNAHVDITLSVGTP